MDVVGEEGVNDVAAAACSSSPAQVSCANLKTPWTRSVAAFGEVIILYKNHTDLYEVKLEEEGIFHHMYGDFCHKDLVGKKYGTKVYPSIPRLTQTGRRGKKRRVAPTSRGGHLYLLCLTPELWTVALKHRTQILYTLDNALISFHLDLKPGSVVLESGTGSGSLTTAMARVIAPHGHVYTFEFNEHRVREAKRDFEKLGTNGSITVTHRDVCGTGFGEEYDGMADAVFLDLPSPWNVIDAAKRALKVGGRVCTFSPCIEQVQKTCAALDARGFKLLRTFECLLKEYEVRTNRYEVPACVAETLSETKGRRFEGADPIVISPDEEKNVRSSKEKKAKRQKLSVEQRIEAGVVKVFGAESRPRPSMAGHTGYLTFASRYADDN